MTPESEIDSEPMTKRKLARIEREAAEQQSLGKDSKLNGEFDKLMKYTAAPALPPVRNEESKKRRKGRPKAGRIIFQQRRIDSLPTFGNVSEVARALGIKHTTLQQWCGLDKHPLPFAVRDGHKIFRKDVLIEWLVATRRFTMKPEYQQ